MSWDIAGHDWAVRLLQGHLIRKDVRHAYLFCGPPGVGRRTLALQFTRALNCLQPPARGEFCGVCRVCRQTAAMQHSDLFVVQSEPESSVLKVDAIRELQQSLALSPYEAQYRIALLLRFHEANPNAQNALLKILEEAPQRVILLLTADSPESLLPTIVSRCEVLRLRPMALSGLQQELENRGLASSDARLLAHLSFGRLGYALRIKDDPDHLNQRQEALETLLTLLGEPRRERLVTAETLSKDKEALRSIFEIWLSFWRDVMLRRAERGSMTDSFPPVNLDLQTEIDLIADQTNLETARKRVIDLEQAIERLGGNVNARLLTEVVLLDCPYLKVYS